VLRGVSLWRDKAAGIAFYECDWVDAADQRLQPEVLGGALQFIAETRAAVRATATNGQPTRLSGSRALLWTLTRS
jgi:hypothetical protein